MIMVTPTRMTVPHFKHLSYSNIYAVIYLNRITKIKSYKIRVSKSTSKKGVQ